MMLSFYKKLGYNIDDYPIAFDNYTREISLPVYFDLTKNQLEIIINAVIESVEQVINA